VPRSSEKTTGASQLEMEMPGVSGRLEYLDAKGEKPRRKRPRIDISKKPHARFVAERAEKELGAAGWQTVSQGEIEKSLASSRYIPKDLGALDLGFGRTLKAPCGCLCEIDKQGNVSLPYSCGQEECQLKKLKILPKGKGRFIKLGEKIPSGIGCWNCNGGELVASRRVKDQEAKIGDRVTVEETRRCNKCSVVEFDDYSGARLISKNLAYWRVPMPKRK